MNNELNAYEEAIRRLSYRLYSTLEISNHLKKKNYNATDIEEAIAKLKEKKYLNDEEFVRLYVIGKGMRKLISKKLLYQELKMHVGNQNWLFGKIDEYYEEYNGGEEEVLDKLLSKKIRQFSDKDIDDKIKQKIINHALRRGFSYDKIQILLEMYINEMDLED